VRGDHKRKYLYARNHKQEVESPPLRQPTNQKNAVGEVFVKSPIRLAEEWGGKKRGNQKAEGGRLPTEVDESSTNRQGEIYGRCHLPVHHNPGDQMGGEGDLRGELGEHAPMGKE